MNRVMITGMGIVSPLGSTIQSVWSLIRNSQSGIKTYLNDPILRNYTSPYNLALIDNFNYKQYKVPHVQNRMNSFLMKATSDALKNSQLHLQLCDKKKIGVCIGSMASNCTKIVEHMEQSIQHQYKNINRLSMLHILSNIPAATVNVQYKLKGPSLTVGTACASGLSAVIEAYKWIKYKEADVVIAGGVEDIYNALYLNSSLRLQAMSTKRYPCAAQSSCPFDMNRSGFVLGQGCGVLILQSEGHCFRRNAKIIAEIVGYGSTSDGYHLVRPEESGESQIQAMKLALKMGKISPSEVKQVNTHATSTKKGDQIQANSILQLFNNNLVQQPYITAFKSYLGHTFGAAGAIELIISLMSMQKNFIPKILNLKQPQVKGLNYAYDHVATNSDIILKNSFGFGGINTSLVVRKYNG